MHVRCKKLIFSVTVLSCGLQVEKLRKLKCLYVVVLAQIARSAGMTAVASIRSSRLHKLIGCVTSTLGVANHNTLRQKVYERFTEARSKRVSSYICLNLEIRQNHLSKVVNENEIQIYGKPH